MPFKLPDDFLITPELREWAELKNWPALLPDVFLSEFRAHHAAKGTRYEDWNRALKNWINWAAPGGRFYSAAQWESKLAAAKAMESPPRKRIYHYDPRGKIPVTEPKRAHEFLQNLIGRAKA